MDGFINLNPEFITNFVRNNINLDIHYSTIKFIRNPLFSNITFNNKDIAKINHKITIAKIKINQENKNIIQ